ncbi:hypothetical protein [Sulfurimonas sp.]|uniref:hypothetical protein n=1 Tax=Sulfurimonas sp. TaxID=2022749 RepID=UPI0025F6BD4E|nr:hypothetical protein [Sulfurimonas sp.]MBW6487568.1 hypothetical protein [Sulfurimonas sp.]
MNNSSNNNAYAGIGGYGDYQTRDNYGKDAYAGKQDPYKKNNTERIGEEKEKQGPWGLDFEILRFFRENYNAGVDFEESPRAFFDEEFMLSMRIKLLKRNFSTIFAKILIMTIFSFSTLFMSTKFTIIAGAFYLMLFLYLVAIPMGFVKYARQYVANNGKDGKLKKIHKTYQGWVRPLETIAMNFLTVLFIFIQILMLFNLEVLYKYILKISEQYLNKMEKIHTYISSLSTSDMQNSILIVSAFYVISYFLYWIVIYKLLAPRWEAVRQENEKAYRRTNQRAARNLKDELTGEV